MLPSPKDIAKKRKKEEEFPNIDVDTNKKDGIFVENGKEYKIDEKTGKKYEIIPKQEINPDSGFSKLHLSDLDLNNLSGEAEKYMAHLRVAPSKEEIARLRQERIDRQREQERIFAEENSTAIEDEKKRIEEAKEIEKDLYK